MSISIKRQQDVEFTCDMCGAKLCNSYHGPQIGELRSSIFYFVDNEEMYRPLPQPKSIYSWELCINCTEKVKMFITAEKQIREE